MYQMVFLAIENASTFSIAVVGAPFALRRGGASHALSTFMITRCLYQYKVIDKWLIT